MQPAMCKRRVKSQRCANPGGAVVAAGVLEKKNKEEMEAEDAG